MSNQNQNQNENISKIYEPVPSEVQRLLLKTAIDNYDKDLLHQWILVNLGVNIPRIAVCVDHCAPFDFVADYIFGIYDFMIVVANRSGGKTENFGILDTIMSWYMEGIEIATVGAIQEQAKKGYNYFKNFSSRFPFSENVQRYTMGATTLKNNSEMKVVTGTMSGVNSPHPQLVFLDEIDLMIWQVLQQAFSMAQSKNDIKARTVVTSTRKFAGGPMQRMIDEAVSKKAKVYMWCIWEVIQPLPTNDPVLLKEIYATFGTALPPKISQANGYYTWRDAITKYVSLDNDTWETEWICKRPGLEGVIYGSSYSDDNNLLMNWSPVGRKGYFYLAEDFGYGEGHDDVILFIFVPAEFDRAIVFDELYLLNMGDEEIWEAINDKLLTYGHRLPDQSKRLDGTITGWVPDPHNLTAIENRKFKGAPMMEKMEESELYLVLNGIGLVQKFLQSGRLMITSRCPRLRLDLLSYKRKKNLDGTYSKDPEKKMDNGPDALRYWVIRLYKQIFANAFAPKLIQNPDVSKRAGEQIAADPTYPIPNQHTTDAPITAGLLSGEVIF